MALESFGSSVTIGEPALNEPFNYASSMMPSGPSVQPAADMHVADAGTFTLKNGTTVPLDRDTGRPVVATFGGTNPISYMDPIHAGQMSKLKL